MQVAKANDIKYAPSECHHKGDCAGTCPKCEAEVRWLEQQLQLRRQLGKAVAVVGVSMGLAALTACESQLADLDSGNEISSTMSQPAGSKIFQYVGDVVEHHASFPGGQSALGLGAPEPEIPDRAAHQPHPGALEHHPVVVVHDVVPDADVELEGLVSCDIVVTDSAFALATTVPHRSAATNLILPI